MEWRKKKKQITVAENKSNAAEKITLISSSVRQSTMLIIGIRATNSIHSI